MKDILERLEVLEKKEEELTQLRERVGVLEKKLCSAPIQSNYYPEYTNNRVAGGCQEPCYPSNSAPFPEMFSDVPQLPEFKEGNTPSLDFKNAGQYLLVILASILVLAGVSVLCSEIWEYIPAVGQCSAVILLGIIMSLIGYKFSDKGSKMEWFFHSLLGCGYSVILLGVMSGYLYWKLYNLFVLLVVLIVLLYGLLKLTELKNSVMLFTIEQIGTFICFILGNIEMPNSVTVCLTLLFCLVLINAMNLVITRNNNLFMYSSFIVSLLTICGLSSFLRSEVYCWIFFILLVLCGVLSKYVFTGVLDSINSVLLSTLSIWVFGELIGNLSVDRNYICIIIPILLVYNSIGKNRIRNNTLCSIFYISLLYLINNNVGVVVAGLVVLGLTVLRCKKEEYKWLNLEWYIFGYLGYFIAVFDILLDSTIIFISLSMLESSIILIVNRLYGIKKCSNLLHHMLMLSVAIFSLGFLDVLGLDLILGVLLVIVVQLILSYRYREFTGYDLFYMLSLYLSSIVKGDYNVIISILLLSYSVVSMYLVRNKGKEIAILLSVFTMINVIFSVVFLLEISNPILATIIYILISATMMKEGFKTYNSGVRIVGLVTIMLSVLKCVLVDMYTGDSLMTILGTIVAGILCFIISYIYGKLCIKYAENE